MAALSPRSFLALVIPAIVVAVGYYWFKKRAEETKRKQKQAKKRHKSGDSSSNELVANCSDVVASSKQMDCAGEGVPVRIERLPPVGAEKSVDDVGMVDEAPADRPPVHEPPLERKPRETSFSEDETLAKEDLVLPPADRVEDRSVALNDSPFLGSEVAASSEICRGSVVCEEEDDDDHTGAMHDKPCSWESAKSASPATASGDGPQADATDDSLDSGRSCAGSDSRHADTNGTTQTLENSTCSSTEQIYETCPEIKRPGVVENNTSLESVESTMTMACPPRAADEDGNETKSFEPRSLPSDIAYLDNSSGKRFVLEGIVEAIEGLKLLDMDSPKTNGVAKKDEMEADDVRTELEVCVAGEQPTTRLNPEANAEPAPSRCSNAGTLENAELQRCSVATDSDINTSAYGTANHSPSEDMLESPAASNFSDIHSEGSTDSGKSAGELLMPGLEMGPIAAVQEVKIYEFEIAQELCGRLIGKQGSTISYIKKNSHANIYIKRHPYSTNMKLCVISGSNPSIEKALQLIRRKFPLNKFSGISLLQINGPGVPVPDTLQLHLPEGILCDVILSSLINGGHFFLQQPTHPTYPSLCRLDQDMLACYTQIATPELPRPVDVGVICAAPMLEGWYRAQVSAIYPETDECDIKFVDYGGYSRLPLTSLRQIRSDFMVLPFQASECYLANVVPVDEEVSWTMEAYSTFEELAQGQILQAQVVAYAEDCIPFVHLYRIQGATQTFINRELVTRGVAQWIEHEM